jgi:nicotinamide-nucleotide amidase
MTDARIVNIGGEIVRGEILNSNARYIADRLTSRGLPVSEIVTLPDDHDRAVATIAEVAAKPGIIIITGGLGGTGDDLTRRIVSEVLKRKLIIDERGKKELEKWYRDKKRSFVKADLMQASCPNGAVLLENRNGIAYGFRIEDNGRMIFCLPGVPKEMKWMFDNEVVPFLEKAAVFDPEYVSRTLTFAGIAEYALDRKVAAIVSRHPKVMYGTRAGYGVTKVVIESRSTNIGPCIAEITGSLDSFLVSKDGKMLEEVVGAALLKQGLTISVAESCTAGYLAKHVTDVSGSSRYFIGGVVAYRNSVKQNILGVEERTLKEYGAVSERTAVEMARGAQKMFGSDIAVSITGIAGPDGGSSHKPVGTVYICVLQNNKKPTVDKNLFSGDREIVRHRSVIRAMYMLFTLLRRGGCQP